MQTHRCALGRRQELFEVGRLGQALCQHVAKLPTKGLAALAHHLERNLVWVAEPALGLRDVRHVRADIRVKDDDPLVVGAIGAPVNRNRHLGALGVADAQLHIRKRLWNTKELSHSRLGLR